MSLEAGRSLRKVREQLRLRFRDIEEASKNLAARHNNPNFVIGLSRLADIENKGIVPSIFRLYSLSTIYGLDLHEVLRWYGVDLKRLPQDVTSLKLDTTRPVHLRSASGSKSESLPDFAPPVDLKKTTYISRQVKSWGKLPVLLLNALDLDNHRYGLVGTDDWSMYPLIPPGSFVQIDDSKRRVVNSGWSNDYGRPIYFIEHRDGFRCCWCTERRGLLILQPHSASRASVEIFDYPDDAEVIGQVVAVAMRLDLARPHRTRSSAAPK